MADVLRRGWIPLATGLVLSYVFLLVATLVAANLARGLGTLELNVFGDGDTAPRWVGLLAYAQGALLLAGAILVAFSAMLAATVESTRSVRVGESIRPWTPFRRGLTRVLAVSRGVLLLVPRLVVVTAVAAVLFVLSVLVVPIGIVIGLVWLLRPSWRSAWMRWPLLAATPFGLLAFASVRWSLWLPFAVIDEQGARAAMRASRDTVRPRWAATARPLAVVCGLGALGVALVVVASELGADETLTGLGSVVVALMVVVGCAIAATLLHEIYGGPSAARPAPAPLGWRPGLAASPGLAMIITIGLIASATWMTQERAVAAPGDPGSPIVNTFGDNLTPNLAVDCLTPAAPCTLRAAVAKAASNPGGTITFSGDGTVDLLGTLNVSASVSIDGTGHRVRIRNTTGNTAIVFGAVPEGSGEVPPGTYGLANLTVASMTDENGIPTSTATGVFAGAGSTTVRNVTFIGHQNATSPGSALHNAASLTVINSTFVGNAASDPDFIRGTIASVGFQLTVNNSTFVDNQGGGVVTYATGIGNSTVTNSLFRGNGQQGGFNCPFTGTLAGNMSNDGSCAAVVGDPARTSKTDVQLALGTFGNHGGPVDTVALKPTSVAIQAGDPTTCEVLDARGQSRGTPCDVGAYQASNGTTTTIDAPLNPAKFGSPVAVNVTVSHPQAVPSGSVQLSGYPGGPATQTLSGGQASFSLTDLPVAVHALTATYVPGAPLEASTGNLNLTVEKQGSATALTIDPAGGTSAAGAPITLNAAVTNAGDASGAVPTGTVQFKDGTTAIGSPVTLTSGAAQATGVVLSGGAHSLTAVYSGSAGFDGSTSLAKSHAVQSPTNVTLTAPSSSVYGQTFGMSVSVAASAGGVPDATGNATVTATNTVTSNSFSAGFGPLVSGVATITSSVLNAGSYNLSASYVGDDHHAGGASTNVAHAVQAANTSTGLVGPSGSTIAGQAASFTATVTPSGTSAVPTGSVSFSVDGGPGNVVPLTGNSATYSPTGLAVGPHSVVATFQPDTANFVTSTSSGVNHTVTATSTSTALTAPATSVSGESVSLVAVVTPAAPSVAVPTGTVTFLSNGTPVGSAPLISGTATLPVTTLAVGAQTLTAEYPATGDLLGSTSGNVAHTVGRATTDVGLVSSVPTPTYGQPLTLTATVGVGSPGSGLPTGTIVFKDGPTVLGTVPLAGGVATLPISTVAAGSRALTADYAGDGRYLADIGALTLTVAQAVPVVTITSVSPTPSRFGSPVTMTASIVSPTGTAPTGMVDFSFGGSHAVVGQAPVVNGVATFTTSDLSLVRTVVGAHYLGDANHDDAFTPNAPDSALVFHTVQKALMSVVISTEKTPTEFGEKIRVFADVAPVGGRIPSGPVSIRVQNFGLAPTTFFDANGRATAEFTGVFPGDPNIIVNVTGDFWFEDSLLNTYTGHHVDLGTATVALAATPAPVGNPTTLTATLGPAATAGIGRVRFLENGFEIGRGDVDAFNKATAAVTFTTIGAHVITASYDGGFGFFHQVSSAPLTVTVPGRAINLNVTPSGSTYGNTGIVQTALFTFDDTPPLPTGTITVKRNGQTLGVGFVSASAQPGLVIAAVPVSIGSLLDVGSHPIEVTYSGDSIFGAVTVASTFLVSKRTPVAVIDNPFPSPAIAGEPVQLSGRLLVPGGLVSPTGTLRLGHGATFCDVPLVNGVFGGSCTVRFPNDIGIPQQPFARYLGDTRYNESRSDIVELTVSRGSPFLELVPTFRDDPFGNRVWTNGEAVPVRWRVGGRGTAVPTGRVEIWTNEGQQFACTAAVTGTCDVRFTNATSDGWIEARFLGDSLFQAVTTRSRASVIGCFSVSVFPGSRVATAPNCAATKYLSGSRVDLVAPARAGYSLAGWSEGPHAPTLEQSPVWVFANRFLEPRYNPVCFTLNADMRPFNLPRIAPEPAPNCDDVQAADFTSPDLDAVRANEVQTGVMRYRAGTKVTLPSTNMLLNVPPNGLRAAIRWSGDGVGADRVVTMDRDRNVLGQLDLPCRLFVVDGPPGATFALAPSFNTSQSQILQRNFNTGGRCIRADGSSGFIAGTLIQVRMTPPPGTWFEKWGAIERLSAHRAPALTAVGERPTAPAATGLTTITVPDYDAAMSGFAAGVSCFELKLNIKDAPITENSPGYPGPSVSASTPNCPAWWLQEQKIPTTTGARWYVSGTDVTVTASTATRRGFVEEFPDSKQIYFRRWTGDITGELAPQAVRTVKITKTTEATAEWYVPARCSKIIVKGSPAASGEVIMGDVGDECPPFQSQFAGVPPAPQAPLGSLLNLAAKPNGTLQTIWHIEGPLVSNALKCREREDYIAFKYDDGATRGQTKAQIDRILMEQGYLPGLTLARIDEEARIMFDKGYTQAGIIGDLKTMGLLDANGAPVADRLRANPCDSVTRDTTLPAGQRAISMTVDGDVIGTAWFCQSVVPTVRVIGIDGVTTQATGKLLDSFGPMFLSSDKAINCPTPGWFLPNTTAVLGSGGSPVPGYSIEGWSLDGVAKGAGALSVPITQDGAPHKVDLTVRVQCRTLTVTAKFGYTATPAPDCPGPPASENRYKQGTQVTVGAGENSNWVFQKWSTGSTYNPVLVTMNDNVTMNTEFREKTFGEQFTESVLDPAVNALGVAAKKVVGGLAYATKIFAQHVIDDVFLKGLSMIGTGLDIGFGLIGVEGKVLDGIVVGLQAPSKSFGAAMDGFDCIEEWAWGRSVPTLDDLKDLGTSMVTGGAKQYGGVAIDTALTEAQVLAAKIGAGDSEALTIATVAAAGGGTGSAPALVLALALDIRDHPDVWAQRAADAGDYALTVLEQQFGKPFTWETSAGDAWTSGGDAFLACMAKNGKTMAGQ